MFVNGAVSTDGNGNAACAPCEYGKWAPAGNGNTCAPIPCQGDASLEELYNYAVLQMDGIDYCVCASGYR